MPSNLTRYNPFNEVLSLREAMDRLFEDSFISPRTTGQWGTRTAAANLFETPDGFILQVPMPGVNPGDVEITTQQDTLTLKWETKLFVPQGATTHWTGFQSGQFQQSFTLPAPINSERAEATYADGVLTLNLPKAEHVKARTLKITTKRERLMGFGHRVYKNYDPRAKIIKEAAEDVFAVTGKSPLLDIATELERIALEDDYFISRKLYPNVDFYSGLIYEAMGLPVAMFPVMFAIGRTSGWIAQWLELVQDKEQKIARPRQIYTGDRTRDYVPIEQR